MSPFRALLPAVFVVCVTLICAGPARAEVKRSKFTPSKIADDTAPTVPGTGGGNATMVCAGTDDASWALCLQSCDAASGGPHGSNSYVIREGGPDDGCYVYDASRWQDPFAPKNAGASPPSVPATDPPPPADQAPPAGPNQPSAPPAAPPATAPAPAPNPAATPAATAADGTPIINDPTKCHTGGGFGNPDYANAGCAGFEPNRPLLMGISNRDPKYLQMGLDSDDPSIRNAALDMIARSLDESTYEMETAEFIRGLPQATQDQIGSYYTQAGRPSLTLSRNGQAVNTYVTKDDAGAYQSTWDQLVGAGYKREQTVQKILSATFFPGVGSATVGDNGDVTFGGRKLGNYNDPGFDINAVKAQMATMVPAPDSGSGTGGTKGSSGASPAPQGPAAPQSAAASDQPAHNGTGGSGQSAPSGGAGGGSGLASPASQWPGPTRVRTADVSAPTPEQSAALTQIVSDAMSSTPPAQYTGAILLPNGSVTYNLSRMNLSSARRNHLAKLLRRRTKGMSGFMVVVNSDGAPLKTIAVRPPR
jgi:hypothetical protein